MPSGTVGGGGEGGRVVLWRVALSKIGTWTLSPHPASIWSPNQPQEGTDTQGRCGQVPGLLAPVAGAEEQS